MIVSSGLVHVSPQGSRAYVVEDFITDTGAVFRVEGLRDAKSDHAAVMEARIPEVEAQLERETAARNTQEDILSADLKIADYVAASDPKSIGLTEKEIVARVAESGARDTIEVVSG